MGRIFALLLFLNLFVFCSQEKSDKNSKDLFYYDTQESISQDLYTKQELYTQSDTKTETDFEEGKETEQEYIDEYDLEKNEWIEDTLITPETSDTVEIFEEKEPVDNDNDGFPEDIDCNDNDSSVYPGAEEVCGDKIDNDCNGIIDDSNHIFVSCQSGTTDGNGSKDAPFPSLSKALNIAQNCTAIHVSGVCNELLKIDKPGIIVIGENNAEIHASKQGIVVEIEAEDVQILNIKISKGTEGIKFQGVNSGYVSGVTVYDITGAGGKSALEYGSSGGTGKPGVGIHLKDSHNIKVDNNKIFNVKGGKGGSIYPNNWGVGGAGGLGIGILLENSTNNIFEKNSISDLSGGSPGKSAMDYAKATSMGWFGFYFDQNSLDNKILETNSVNGEPVIFVSGESGRKIEGLSLNSGANTTNLGKAVIVNSSNITIENVEINGFKGSAGETGSKEISNDLKGLPGGSGAGFFVLNSQNITIKNCKISNISGGKGGLSGVNSSGGNGGIATGIFLKNSENCNISGNEIFGIKGGNGGIGVIGSGGTGGKAFAIFLENSKNNVFDSNNIYDLSGGKGGAGGGGGSAGAEQTYFGFFIDNESFENQINSTNKVFNEPVLYFYNSDSVTIKDYQLENANITNLGKLVIINSSNITVTNNKICGFKGETGKTGNTFANGKKGGMGTGIYILNSQNITVSLNEVCDIHGGMGGTGGRMGDGGKGGFATAIRVEQSDSININSNNVFSISGGTGGKGGFQGCGGTGGSASAFTLFSTTNFLHQENSVEITGGKTGAKGTGAKNCKSEKSFSSLTCIDEECTCNGTEKCEYPDKCLNGKCE